ncbi:MAG: putative flap endonuclease-1-like 5' DNA nuclease, partial [Flavobacteriaceae bacterium]
NPVNKRAAAEKARSSYVSYNMSSPELDFDSFGYAEKSNKDDLTLIKGVGPYIELKLNEIGIYNYDQIRRLKESDIRIITTLIDFFPGRIERDDWVGQAQQLQEN